MAWVRGQGSPAPPVQPCPTLPRKVIIIMIVNITIEDVPVDALPLTVTIERGYEPEDGEESTPAAPLFDDGGLIPLLIDAGRQFDPKEA